MRKVHENPAIGVLLCASKDDEAVEYALSRTAGSALIAEYQTQLPDKALLQASCTSIGWRESEATVNGARRWAIRCELTLIPHRPRLTQLRECSLRSGCCRSL